jgi:hypothetical protein
MHALTVIFGCVAGAAGCPFVASLAGPAATEPVGEAPGSAPFETEEPTAAPEVGPVATPLP